MPLHKGSSEKVIGTNIREMRAAGHPEAQAVAAAERMADKSRGRRYADMDLGGKAAIERGAVDAPMHEKRDKKDKGDKKGSSDKVPDLARELGEGMGDEEEGHDEEDAKHAAGEAASHAMRMGDGHALVRALAAGMKAHGFVKDDDDTDADEPANPWGAAG